MTSVKVLMGYLGGGENSKIILQFAWKKTQVRILRILALLEQGLYQSNFLIISSSAFTIRDFLILKFMKYLPYFSGFIFYIQNTYISKITTSKGMRQATNGEKSCMVTWEHDIGGGVRARVTGVWGLLDTTGLWYYHPPIQLLLFISEAFLVVQWLRICLAVQGTWVQSLVKELRSHKQPGN